MRIDLRGRIPGFPWLQWAFHVCPTSISPPRGCSYPFYRARRFPPGAQSQPATPPQITMFCPALDRMHACMANLGVGGEPNTALAVCPPAVCCVAQHAGGPTASACVYSGPLISIPYRHNCNMADHCALHLPLMPPTRQSMAPLRRCPVLSRMWWTTRYTTRLRARCVFFGLPCASRVLLAHA